MRFPPRRSDDADVIRARLRLLLAERDRASGWVPEDAEEGLDAEGLDAEGLDAEGLDAAERRTAGGGPEASEGVRSAPRSSGTRRPGEDTVTGPLTDGSPTGTDLPGGIGRHRVPGTAARWDPGRPGARALWLSGLMAALALAGWTWLERPRVEPVSGVPVPSSAPATTAVGEAAETSETVVVSVVGQVTSPGLVTLPTGARVADALAAAGGLLPGADPASVNLAAVVVDGEQLAVGLPGAPPPAATGPAGAGSGGRVDLNTADVGALDALPGIGPVLAQRIVEHRTREGPFRSVDQLDDVPGIGPTIAAELADLVDV
ncbi:ComEA family DNA-binding protein [Blastococcus tunisiensis]|uniref:Competence protein ComEA n=1 Tax=Blastococcus tunisiensis TaxID=1798228 RepID=A0A1I1ZZM7_9ACTN|nr:helix-hairpin-helix domain-containing protein [Blastococcus sp. DSM 46838]SFE37142.1 competence protein ComEA [Blastococcus sp. DSM 46838]